MPTPRGAGQAVEVNGKIYVIGGVRSNNPGDAGAPIALGSTDQLVLGTVEEYDPATNQWRARSTMPTARNHFFAGAVDGDKLSGSVKAGAFGSFPFSGNRV